MMQEHLKAWVDSEFEGDNNAIVMEQMLWAVKKNPVVAFTSWPKVFEALQKLGRIPATLMPRSKS